jgi:diaminohydroxyphosphoribosylaminopyrimidine deaminase/5-amino-6-(5-phosphoribosylamino)uracil reductase
MVDPNPLVQGRGIKRLRQAGIEVKVGVLKEACERLNEDFCTFVSKGRPFVILKLAASLDGKIAAASGDARWISGETSRRFVHQLRNQVDAVLVGAETVRKDNPRLTCRIRGGRDPLRVILDGRLRTTPQAQVIAQPSGGPTLVVTTVKKPNRKIRLLERYGAEVLSLPGPRGKVAFSRLLHELGRRGIKSVMVEGGAEIAASALRAGAVDKVLFFYAPKLLGGEGKEMVGLLGISRVAHAIRVHKIEVERLGNDVVVSGYIF